jgi:hypothetical protein
MSQVATKSDLSYDGPFDPDRFKFGSLKRLWTLDEGSYF